VIIITLKETSSVLYTLDSFDLIKLTFMFLIQLQDLNLAPALEKLLKGLGIDVEMPGLQLLNTVHLKYDEEFFYTNALDRRVVESFVIQAFGQDRTGCTHCIGQNGMPPKGIYIECRTLAGFNKGGCGNCKRRDHSIQCTYHESQITLEEQRSKTNSSGAARNRG
jgi:Protein of unknown function (DUF3716)